MTITPTPCGKAMRASTVIGRTTSAPWYFFSVRSRLITANGSPQSELMALYSAAIGCSGRLRSVGAVVVAASPGSPWGRASPSSAGTAPPWPPWIRPAVEVNPEPSAASVSSGMASLWLQGGDPAPGPAGDRGHARHSQDTPLAAPFQPDRHPADRRTRPGQRKARRAAFSPRPPGLIRSAAATR